MKIKRPIRVILVGPMITGSKAWKKCVATLGIRNSQDFIIGIDGGAKKAKKIGLKLDLAIGDWDSLNMPVKKIEAPKIISLEKDKNYSDTHFAITEALRLNPVHILALGHTGGRLDHELAVIGDMAAISQKKPSGKNLKTLQILSPDGHGYFLGKYFPTIRLNRPKGEIVSLFSLSERVTALKLKGLKYSFTNEKLKPSSRAISNVFVGKTATIQISTGSLFVYLPKNPDGV